MGADEIGRWIVSIAELNKLLDPFVMGRGWTADRPRCRESRVVHNHIGFRIAAEWLRRPGLSHSTSATGRTTRCSWVPLGGQIFSMLIE